MIMIMIMIIIMIIIIIIMYIISHQRRERSPWGLVHAKIIQDGAEDRSFLCIVNSEGVRSEDVHTFFVERESQVIRDLTPHGDDATCRALEIEKLTNQTS